MPKSMRFLQGYVTTYRIFKSFGTEVAKIRESPGGSVVFRTVRWKMSRSLHRTSKATFGRPPKTMQLSSLRRLILSIFGLPVGMGVITVCFCLPTPMRFSRVRNKIQNFEKFRHRSCKNPRATWRMWDFEQCAGKYLNFEEPRSCGVKMTTQGSGLLLEVDFVS